MTSNSLQEENITTYSKPIKMIIPLKCLDQVPMVAHVSLPSAFR